ncbi:EpsG family protein [Schleiferiaceae bacterium]|nr:EpsG family protein [Schleiferiaceae bacterium]
MLVPYSLLLGFRPISSVFGDMLNYSRYFRTIGFGNISLFGNSDVAFTEYIRFFSGKVSVKTWFYMTALLTMLTQLIAVRRLFQAHTFLYFLSVLTSLNFFASVTNGIRSGLALGIFLLALSFRKQKIIKLAFFVLAVGCHKSILLLVVTFFVVSFYSNTVVLIRIWLVSIFVVYFLGSAISEAVAVLNLDSTRLDNYLLVEANKTKFSVTGFRYDFLIYGSLPIILFKHVAGKTKEINAKYRFLINLYIVSNTFWVLLMYANYSNRFAALSWSLIPILIIYPFISMVVFKKSRHKAFLIIFIQLISSYLLQF